MMLIRTQRLTSKAARLIAAAAALVLSVTAISPAFAATPTVGNAPWINTAVASPTQVLVQWEAPTTSITNLAGASVGPTGYEVQVHLPGNLSKLSVATTCGAVTAVDDHCYFIKPTGKSKFDVWVRAKFTADGVTQYSPWAVDYIDTASMGDIENMLVQAAGNGEAVVTWNNASTAALSATRATVAVDGVSVATPNPLGESATLTNVAVGAHTVTLTLANALGTIATYSVPFNQVAVPAAPIVDAVDNGDGTATLNWHMAPGVSATANAWDLVVDTTAADATIGCTTIQSSARTCTVTGIDSTAEYQFALRAVYGAGALGDIAYAYLNVTAVQGVMMSATGADHAILSWTVDALLEPRVDQVKVLVPGVGYLDCPNALATTECAVTGLTVGDAYEYVIQLFDASGALIMQSDSTTNPELAGTFAGIPEGPDHFDVVDVDSETGTVSFTWSYVANVQPDNVTGWEVLAQQEDGLQPVGTCGGQLAATEMSCTLTGISVNNGALIEVRPMYGRGLLGSVGRGWAHIAPITFDQAQTSDSGSMVVTWTVNPLIDAITNDVQVSLDGVGQVCPEASMGTCTFTGLDAGTTYTVSVDLTDADLLPLASNTLDIVPSAIPAAPTVNTEIIGDSAYVSWSLGAGTVPADINHWDVQVVTGSGNVITGTCADGTASVLLASCTITGIDPNETYQIQVRANYGTNLLGDTGYDYINVTPLGQLSVKPQNDTEALARWTVDPFIDAQVDTVNVYLDDFATPLDCPDALQAQTCTIADLVAGDAHNFRVELLDINGDVLADEWIAFTYTGTPNAPIVDVSPIEHGTATISWLTNDDENAFGITQWDINLVTVNGQVIDAGSCVAQQVDVATSSCTISGLAADDQVAVEVSAVYGAGALGAIGYGYLNATSAFDSSSLVQSAADSLDLTWAINPLWDARVADISVVVDGDTANPATCPDAMTAGTCTIPALSVGQHDVTISALDANGDVVDTTAVTGTIQQAPTAPDLNVVYNGTTATLSWSYSGAHEPVSEWQITVTTDAATQPIGTCMVATLDAAVSSCDVAGLDPAAGYEWELTPLYGLQLPGQSAFAYSNLHEIETLTADAINETDGQLAWSFNPLVEPRVDSVEFFVNGNRVLTCGDALTFGSCDITGLNAYSQYDVTMNAYDVDGRFIGTKTLNFTFVALPPAPNVVVAPQDERGVATVSWSYPAALPIGVTGYELIVSRSDGQMVAGTCADSPFTTDTNSCTITDVANTTGIAVEIRATYGVGLVSDPNYAYLNVDNISNLAAVTSADGELTVTWDRNLLLDPRVTDVAVYVDGVQVDPAAVAGCADAFGASTCVVDGLTMDVSHEIRVALLDVNGEFTSSTINAVAYSAPTAPYVQTVVDQFGNVTVQWNPSGPAAGITGWQVIVTGSTPTVATGTCANQDFTRDQTSCSVSGFGPADSYEVEVTPTYGVGLLGAPGYSFVNLQPIANLTAVPSGNNSASATWDVDPMVSPHVADVQVSFNGGLPTTCADAAATNTCEVDGLLVGQDYTVTVTLFDADGRVISSNTTPFTFAGVPTAPLVTFTPEDEHGVATLSWSYDGPLPTGLSNWQVVVSAADGSLVDGSCADINFTIDVQSCTIFNVTPATSLAAEVTSSYDTGLTSPIGYAYLHVTPVSNIVGLTSADGELTTTWLIDPLVAPRVDSITVSVNGDVQTCPDALAAYSCVVGGLTPNATNTITVTAFDADGVNLGTSTSAAIAYSAPTEPTVSVVDHGATAHVSWTHPDAAAQGISGWQVLVSTMDDGVVTGSCTATDFDVTTLSCDLADLNPAASYEIAVTPVYGTGLVGRTGYALLRLDPINSLRVTTGGDTTANVDWLVDPLVDGRVASVVVTVDGLPVMCTSDPVLSSNCDLDLLMVGQQYTIKVQLLDDLGNVIGEKTTAYVHAKATSIATNFTATVNANDDIVLTWDFPQAAEGLINGWSFITNTDSTINNENFLCADPSGNIPANVRRCVVTGIDTTAAYLFELRADFGNAGQGSPVYASVRTTTVEGWTVSATAQDASDFTWTPGLLWDSIVSSYIVKDSTGALVCSVDMLAGITTCNYAGLAAGTGVDLTFEGYDAYGTLVNTFVKTLVQPVVPVATNVRTSVVRGANQPGTSFNMGVMTVRWDYDTTYSTAEVIGWTVTAADKQGVLMTGSCFDTVLLATDRSCTVDLYSDTWGSHVTVTPIYDQNVDGNVADGYWGPTQLVTLATIYPVYNTTTSAQLIIDEPIAGIDTYNVELTNPAGDMDAMPYNAGDPYTFQTDLVAPNDQLVGRVRTVVDGVESFDAFTTDTYTQADVPDPITTFNVTETGVARQLRLSWNAPTTYGSDVLEYLVTINDGVNVITKSVQGTSTSLTLNNMVVGGGYDFTILPQSFVGAALDVATASIVTKMPPAAATASTVVLASATSATVSFSPSVDIAHRSAVTGFTVSALPAGGTIAATVGANATSGTVTGLKPGVAYTFVVRALSAAGPSAASNVLSLTAPSVPAAYTQRVNALTADFNWRAAKGAVTGYSVEITDLNGNTVTRSVSAATLAYTEAGLTAGGTYTSRVRAEYGSVHGPWSQNLTSFVNNRPQAPINAASSLTSSTSAMVTWSTPDAVPGVASAGSFHIVASPMTAGIVLPSGIGSTTRQAVVTGLTAGTAYTFAVVADSAVGSSDPSVESTALFMPGKVSDFTAVQSGDGHVDLSWTAPQGDVTGYTVTVKPQSGSSYKVSAAFDATSLVLSGMVTGNTYDFDIVANFGRLNAGAVASNSVTILNVPSAPTAQAVALADATSALVSFTAPAAAADRAAVTGYTISVSPLTDGIVTPLLTSADTSGVVSGLQAGITYKFTVVADSVAGASHASSVLTLTMPTAPLTVQARPTAKTALVTWNAAAGNVTSYVVTLDNGVDPVTTLTAAADATSATATDLAAGSTYTVTVYAMYGSVYGPVSDPATMTTDSVPDAPTAVKATVVGQDALKVTWTAPQYGFGKAAVTGYVLTATADDGSSVSLPGTLAASARDWTFTGLNKNVGYTFTVAATSVVGNSAESIASDVTYTTAAVSGLTAVPGAADGALVEWTAPLGATTAYIVTATPVDPSLPTLKAQATGDAVSLVIGGMTVGADYNITVLPVFGPVFGPVADPVFFHCKTTPNAPTLVSAVATSSTTTHLVWSAGATGADIADVTGFTIKVTPATPSVVIPDITVANTTEADVTGLDPNTTYTYSIKADSTAGQSSQSNLISTLSPGPALSVRAASIGADVSVTWAAPRGSVTSYVVTLTNGTEVHQTTVSGSTRVANFYGLTAAATYDVNVQSIIAGVLSDASALTQVTIIDVPVAPVLSSSTPNSTTARISWLPATYDITRAAVTGYVVTVTVAGVTSSYPLSNTTFQFDVTGMAPDVEYAVTVHATSAVGNSVESDVLAAYAAGKPSNVQVAVDPASVATVSWTAAKGAVTDYLITATPQVGAVLQMQVAGDQTSAVLDTKLDYLMGYVVTVQANYGAINIGPSVAALAVGAPAPVLPDPFQRPAFQLSGTTLTVDFASLLPTPPVTVAGYYFTVNGKAVTGCGTASAPLATASCVVTGIAPSTDYVIVAYGLLDGFRAARFTYASNAWTYTSPSVL